MAKNTTWHDNDWLLLLQIYLRKPVVFLVLAPLNLPEGL